MKELLPLINDYIIESKFIPNEIETDNGKKIDWVDEKLSEANGKYLVEHVLIYVPIFNMDESKTNKYYRMYIDKIDIVDLHKKIEQIESKEIIGTPDDGLPF